jgi:hypothetical protein
MCRFPSKFGKVVSTKPKSIKNVQPKVCCDYIFSVFLKVFLGSPVSQKKNPSGQGGDGWGFEFNNISREEYDVMLLL